MTHDPNTCPICTPAAEYAPSPTLKATPAAEVDTDLAQMVGLFRPLDGKGRALALALVATIGRLQGVRG